MDILSSQANLAGYKAVLESFAVVSTGGFSLSDLYLMKNNKDSSEVYLKQALNIQYYNFLIKNLQYFKK